VSSGHNVAPVAFESALRRNPAARISVDFLMVATIFFAAGMIAAPLLIGEAVTYFYQPYLLALVHTFTLGWITAAIMGVMYRYVPALTQRELPYPRIAFLQLILFVFGTVGMIVHFALGIWPGTWSAAIVVIISIAMFAANLMPCLWSRIGRAAAETGMALSILMLFAAACVGFTLALDKTLNFMGGDVITNLAGHAHLAALGWVTLTICAVTYRMMPAFILPETRLPKAALWQIYALALGVIGLAVTLLAGLPGITAWACIIALALMAYALIVARMVRTRRARLDWSSRHMITAILWLTVAAGLGIVLTRTGTQSAMGARIATIYGMLGLMGWIGNFIIGMSQRLFPGLVSRTRGAMGWPAIAVARLSITQARRLVFVAFNAGLIVLAVGFSTSEARLAVSGAVIVAIGGLVYSATILWTLSYAYRRAPAAAGTLSGAS
ncbi:MAG: hypothetical protein ACREQE_08810, partial [Candidatus Binataceae bacterium]